MDLPRPGRRREPAAPGAAGLPLRRAGRVVVLDPGGRVLLLRPAGIAPAGGIGPRSGRARCG
jgi:hypothetical protein